MTNNWLGLLLWSQISHSVPGGFSQFPPRIAPKNAPDAKIGVSESIPSMSFSEVSRVGELKSE